MLHLLCTTNTGSPSAILPREILVMDNIINPTPKVTTGPLPASAKVYVTPDAAPDLRVPLREIELSSPSEPRVRVYDTTGPYTDPTSPSTCARAWRRTRRAWVLERGGVEEYDGRPIQPIDNGNVKSCGAAAVPQHAAAVARPRRQADHPVRMGARRRHHQGDDLRRRARESRPQDGARRRRRSGWPTARASARRCPSSSRRSSCARKWRWAAPSSRPTSTTASSSRWRSAAISW